MQKKCMYIYIYIYMYKFSSFNQPYCLFYCRSKCPKIFQSFCVTQKLYTIDFSYHCDVYIVIIVGYNRQ